jgi:hypothetical protein
MRPDDIGRSFNSDLEGHSNDLRDGDFWMRELDFVL